MTTRRSFLMQLSALGMGLRTVPGHVSGPPVRWRSDPFTLGLASGDPSPDGVVLWTRLDATAQGGAQPETLAVRWEVAEDEQMRRVVRRGEGWANGAEAHSVHVEVRGLAPGRWYWYRFISGDAVSAVGRARTLPAPGSPAERLRLVVASCQHYEEGYYAAWEHVSREDCDLVAFLGDYIYESTVPGRPRQHGAGEPVTLDEYRARYALYKSDPQLRAAHASCPWIATWDDHEVDNDYAGAVPQDNVPIAQFLLRRAAAYRAWYEHMPVRRSAMPAGPDATLYRSFAWGSLADVQVLDTRRYRDDQSCGPGRRAPCAQWSRPDRSMLGRTQERWLQSRLAASRSRWNVLAQQVQMTPADTDPGPGESYAMDSWNGYPAARQRLFSFLGERRVPNVVTLTGDVHAAYASEMPRDHRAAKSANVGVEFICTSISSAGDGVDRNPQGERLIAANPWMKFHNARRGYIRCDVTAAAWRSDYRVLPHVHSPDAPIRTEGSFVTPAGSPTVERV